MKKLHLLLAVGLLTISNASAQTKENTAAKTAATEQAYPKYPGGVEEFQKYIESSVKDASQYKGGVYVAFDVDTDGSVSNFEFMASPGSKYEAEIKKLIEDGKKWVPARRDGKLVKAKVKVPIRFIKA